MNLMQKAQELVKTVKTNGFNEIVFPQIKVGEQSTDKYIYLKNVYYQPRFMDYCGDYFDHDSFKEDFVNHLYKMFPNCTIRIWWQTQELEIEYV